MEFAEIAGVLIGAKVAERTELAQPHPSGRRFRAEIDGLLVDTVRPAAVKRR